MDFNLNDFSGIQNDDSQFMDESNVNINNVWQNGESPIRLPIQEQVEELKQPPEQKLICLQDINFGSNVMDMSRISNHDNQEMTQKESDIIQSLQNNQDPFSQFQNYLPDSPAVIMDEQPMLVPAMSAPVVLESKPAETAATNEWKKPQIVKKKRGGKKPPKPETKVEMPAPEVNFNNDFQGDINIDDILIDLPLNDIMMIKAPSAPVQQAAFESRTQNNKYARDSPEPQPLFDCLFCVGIHEHLVLQTVKEKNLKFIYGEQVQNFVNVEIEAEEDYKDIDRAFAINSLMYDQYKRIKIEPKRESIVDDNYEVPNIYASKRQLQSLFQPQNIPQVYRSPMQGTINKFIDRVAQISLPVVAAPAVETKAVAPANGSTYQVTAAQQYPQQQMSDGGSSQCNEELMISNMLENFDDIDPEDQSMFMNLNIRNRRQKILHNVSFESEMYDVYAPVFTSDEESITSNSESSMSSSRGSEMVGTGESQSASSRGSGESSSSSVDSQATPEYDSSKQNSNMSQEILNDQITPNKGGGNTLNERDFDNNSENNNSSLSSIHREIQEAPAEESSNQVVLQGGKVLMPNQGHIMRNVGGKLTLAESGGCQVEEMQDDTVMKQCKSMFRSGATGQQSNEIIPNESFQDQIFQQRQIQLANQLESLDQKELMQLDLMNLDTSPSKRATIQTDMEDLPSIARSSQKRGAAAAKKQNFEIKLSEAQQQDYIMNSFSTTSYQKKTTGRFNTKALMGSEQSEKRTSVANKLQNKLKTGNNSISDSKKFNEDDSIIKILPGFTSSHLKNASEQVDDSAMNPMSEHFQAQQAHGLTTAFGAESLIQPINYLPEETTNHFLMQQIQEVNNVSNSSQQTPQHSTKKAAQNSGGEIDFYNHHFRSSKNNKLQLVDSDSERYEQSMKDEEDKIQSLSPIVKKQDQSNQYMVENQAISSKKSKYGNRINLAQIDNKGQTQKINLKMDDSPKKLINMRTQKMVSRKTTGGQIVKTDQIVQNYGQMGKNQNLQHLRKASNASIGSNKQRNGGSKQFYYEAAISASMGALPGYDEVVDNIDNQTLGTSESQQQLEELDQAKGMRSKSKRATGSGIKQPTDMTPVKSRVAASKQVEPNSKTTKKQVTKKSSNMEATAPIERVTQKAVTQKIKQLKLNQNNLQKKEANNKGGNYGMLSKEQKKLMLQLQKKTDDLKPQGAPKQNKESNQKNVRDVVRDNYFKLTGSDQQEDAEHSIPQSKTAMKNKPQPPSLYSQNEKAGTLQQKRSSTNLKNRSRERSSEMKQKKTNDHNKYRSSMVEPQMYAQDNAHANQLLVQHQATQSQSVTRGNEMLIIEKKNTSEPQVKTQLQKALAIPSLNLDTVNSNSLDMGDQFLKTMNLQNPQQSSLNKFVKVQQQNVNQQSIKNINLKAMQKPIGDFASQNNNKFLRQIKYQQVQQQLKTQSLTQPGTVPETDRNSLEQIQEVTNDARNSYLHSSTSQLQNFSVSQIPGEEKHLFKNMISKIENQSLFAGGDQFVLPAQSHRNPQRSAQQKLSISAGKNVIGKNKNDFMKSTANLKKDFSEIQSKDMIENETQIEGLNQKHGQTSKLSIEQDIKFLKMSLNNDNKKKNQSIEKQTKNYMNTVGQNNRAQKAATGSNTISGGQNTLSDAGVGSQVSNSMRKSRVSSLEMKEKKLKGNNQRLLTKNKSPTKTPSLQIQTKHVKPKMEMNSGSVSTKSNKVVYRKMKQERTDTETSEQKDKTKQQNYKKLILENNMKILQYQQKSQNQTPKQGTQLGFVTNKQNVLLDAGGDLDKKSNISTKQQFINQLTANQFQTQQTTQKSQGGNSQSSKMGKFSGEKLESNFSSMPQMVHKDSQNSGKSAQYRQLQSKQHQATQDKTPNMQYFKTNEYDNNTLEAYGRSEEEGYSLNDGSGLGHISSGEQQIGQMTREKLNNAQNFNSSVANKSNSLFSGQGYPTNQQKSSGGGAIGHASIGGLGTTGLTFGAANTTANTNSYIGGNHTNNKSGMQNSLNQRSLLNNFDTAQDSSNQKQTRKKQSLGNARLAKKSSMKASQDNLEF